MIHVRKCNRRFKRFDACYTCSIYICRVLKKVGLFSFVSQRDFNVEKSNRSN